MVGRPLKDCPQFRDVTDQDRGLKVRDDWHLHQAPPPAGGRVPEDQHGRAQRQHKGQQEDHLEGGEGATEPPGRELVLGHQDQAGGRPEEFGQQVA